MKIQLLLLSICFCATPAWSESIAEVLERSQAARLATLPVAPAGIAETLALRESFDRLRRSLSLAVDAELRVVGAGAVAETLQGHVIALNASLGELPEICRLFVLAHELGHVELRHWAQRIELYREYVPGEVNQAQTDAVAPVLGRAASQQAHEQEFAADGYAMRALLDLGYTRDELIDMFIRLGQHGDTATHPATARRVAHLRSIDDERRLAQRASANEANAQ